MDGWFTVNRIDNRTYAICEYLHQGESINYLLIGDSRSMLIDTGLGIKNIRQQVSKLTKTPVTAVATHIHWDHIGGHRYFPDFYVHEKESHWLEGRFPMSVCQVKRCIRQDCDLPVDSELGRYEFFQGTPSRVLEDGDIIHLGGRSVRVLHTPGHSPGHMCFFEEATGYLFAGDMVYTRPLLYRYPPTNHRLFLRSLQKIAALGADKIFPAHHGWDVPDTILNDALEVFLTVGVPVMQH